jgi:hypothetical protein
MRTVASVVVSLTVLVAGCGRDSVVPITTNPTAPTPSPPIPAGPTVTVTGEVRDSGGNPVNAMVGAFPLRWSNAWSGPWGRAAQADASGRYRITNVPEHHDTVYVKAWKDGYAQQCAVAVRLETDTGAELTLTQKANVLLTGLPSSPNTRHVSGTVYEMRDTERRPVAGVWVGWEPIMDTVVAETFTDAHGRYRVCGLPRERVEVFAVRIGTYRPLSQVVEAGGDAVSDFELP